MTIPKSEPTLEQRLISVMRFRHYSRRTEEGYVGWYKRYVLWHKERAGRAIHPREMGAAEVEAFLTHLAVNRDVSPSTQNQALNALIFLYREVLEIPLEGIDALRARERKHLPVVLAVEEVKELLAGVRGDAGLAVKGGLRLAASIKRLHARATAPQL